MQVNYYKCQKVTDKTQICNILPLYVLYLKTDKFHIVECHIKYGHYCFKIQKVK